MLTMSKFPPRLFSNQFSRRPVNNDWHWSEVFLSKRFTLAWHLLFEWQFTHTGITAVEEKHMCTAVKGENHSFEPLTLFGQWLCLGRMTWKKSSHRRTLWLLPKCRWHHGKVIICNRQVLNTLPVELLSGQKWESAKWGFRVSGCWWTAKRMTRATI